MAEKQLVKVDRRKLPHSESWNRAISKSLKGRVPWNKGIGNENSSIRKGIKTRREFKGLREMIRMLNKKNRRLFWL